MRYNLEVQGSGFRVQGSGFRVSPEGVLPLDGGMRFLLELGIRNEGGGFAEILRLRPQLFWHSLSHIRRFSTLRMTKRGDARKKYSSHQS